MKSTTTEVAGIPVSLEQPSTEAEVRGAYPNSKAYIDANNNYLQYHHWAPRARRQVAAALAEEAEYEIPKDPRPTDAKIIETCLDLLGAKPEDYSEMAQKIVDTIPFTVQERVAAIPKSTMEEAEKYHRICSEDPSKWDEIASQVEAQTNGEVSLSREEDGSATVQSIAVALRDVQNWKKNNTSLL